MRKAVIGILLLPALAFADHRPIAFTNVTVIPMTSDTEVAKQTVIVKGDRIVQVGAARKVRVPKNALAIDGTGKFLVPGLAEMHGHIPPPTAPPQAIESTLFLYVANGITTVRGMLGHDGQLELRKKAIEGTIDSPTLYLAGPSFNGNSINSPDEAIEKVKKQKAEGWDLLKVHPGLTRDEYDAMATTARALGIRFGGHVPVDVGLMRAIEMGQETFDHLDGYVEYLEGDKGAVDEGKLAFIAQKTREAGAWVVPTMALWETLLCAADLKTLQSYPELKYVSKAQVEQWSKAFENRMASPTFSAEGAQRVVAARQKVLRALNESGVKILMGTDAPQQFSVPGFSLHRELERMSAAGMTPYQILVSGTVNVGKYFAASDKFGTIEKGSRADLLLLDANPRSDIRNVSKISGVLARGRWYSRQAIDARLEAIRRQAQ